MAYLLIHNIIRAASLSPYLVLFSRLKEPLLLLKIKEESGEIRFEIKKANKAFRENFFIEGNIKGRHLSDLFPVMNEFMRKHRIMQKVKNGEKQKLESIALYLEMTDEYYLTTFVRISSISSAVILQPFKNPEFISRQTLDRRLKLDRIAKIGNWDYYPLKNQTIWSESNYEIFEWNRESPPDADEFHQLIHPDDREKVDEYFSKVLTEGIEYKSEFRIITETGKEKYIQTIGHPIKNQDGIVYRIAGTDQDITESKGALKYLTESRRRLKEAQKMAGMGNFEYSQEDNRQFTSEELRSILGFSKGEALDRNSFEEIIHPDDRQKVHEFIDEVKREGSGSCEFRILRKDNREQRNIYSTVDSRGRFQDRDLVIFGTLQDITWRKQIENELTSARKRAEIALEEVKKANSKRTEYIDNLTHDIRTPLNNLSGVLKLIKDSNLSGEQKEYIDMAEDSIEHIINIIDDVLDFSRIEAGSLELENEQFNFHEMLKRTLKPFEYNAGKEGIEFKTAVDDKIEREFIGDPKRIKQVLNNLLSNAIKYTPEGTIDVYVFEKTKDSQLTEIEFKITDTGSGISDEEIKHLFQRFYTIKNKSGRHKSTGLGLAITKELVELMGGTISVESQIDRGSTFTFNLFLQHVFPGETKKREKDTAKIKLNRMFIGDDDIFTRKILTKAFSRRDIEVVSFSNGKELFSRYRMNPGRVDAVMVDLNMPIMDGEELLTKIKEFEENTDAKRTPVFILSGKNDQQIKKRMKDLGAEAFLVKPFDIETFFNHL